MVRSILPYRKYSNLQKSHPLFNIPNVFHFFNCEMMHLFFFWIEIWKLLMHSIFVLRFCQDSNNLRLEKRGLHSLRAFDVMSSWAALRSFWRIRRKAMNFNLKLEFYWYGAKHSSLPKISNFAKFTSVVAYSERFQSSQVWNDASVFLLDRILEIIKASNIFAQLSSRFK